MHILTQVKEQNRGARILAQGNLLLLGYFRVLEDHVQHLTGTGCFLISPCLLKGIQDILWKVVVGLDAQAGQCLRYLRYMDIPHVTSKRFLPLNE